MEKENLNKIIDLLRSEDIEMQRLGESIFVNSKPTSFDYTYLDNYHNLFAGETAETFIRDFGIAIRKL